MENETLTGAKETAAKPNGHKGKLIGAYVPDELKDALQRRAKGNHRTLSQELIAILTTALNSSGGSELDQWKAQLIGQIQGFQPSYAD